MEQNSREGLRGVSERLAGGGGGCAGAGVASPPPHAVTSCRPGCFCPGDAAGCCDGSGSESAPNSSLGVRMSPPQCVSRIGVRTTPILGSLPGPRRNRLWGAKDREVSQTGLVTASLLFHATVCPQTKAQLLLPAASRDPTGTGFPAFPFAETSPFLALCLLTRGREVPARLRGRGAPFLSPAAGRIYTHTHSACI